MISLGGALESTFLKNTFRTLFCSPSNSPPAPLHPKHILRNIVLGEGARKQESTERLELLRKVEVG